MSGSTTVQRSAVSNAVLNHFPEFRGPGRKQGHRMCQFSRCALEETEDLNRKFRKSRKKDVADVVTYFLYACESWTLIAELQRTNTSHGSEVLPQDITHLIQRPCYQRGSPCQDPAGNWTTRRPPDDRKETQTAVVWSCLPFIRSGQTILEGTVKGGRRKGRQRKRWEDNSREWTGLEFGKSQRAVENGEKWGKLFVKSSVVRQQPPRLRDI